jgi:predicted nucleotidyltransferase
MIGKTISIPPSIVAEGMQKMLYWFFAYPNQAFGINELSTKLKIAKTTTVLVVQLLAKEKFLTIEYVGRYWRVTVNTAHEYMVEKKVPYHLSLMYESKIIKVIQQKFPGAKAIVLFGSYRKGDDTQKSDVDIAVEVLGTEQPKQVLLGTFKKLGYRENVPVTLLVFNRQHISLNLFANIANGIILDGFLEVRP